ncbi:hypothetical protein CLCR_10907 [Cladophialophora carrionii]|uniref:Uncharacterized protein n=1 Tax=Cladophialophora carrionii TaxID=86049 RepID=A0A1C1CZR5_9EURO|nr:hypothetical protein CLCR_10907 [Cladophialophora carrionii]
MTSQTSNLELKHFTQQSFFPRPNGLPHHPSPLNSASRQPQESRALSMPDIRGLKEYRRDFSRSFLFRATSPHFPVTLSVWSIRSLRSEFHATEYGANAVTSNGQPAKCNYGHGSIGHPRLDTDAGKLNGYLLYGVRGTDTTETTDCLRFLRELEMQL